MTDPGGRVARVIGWRWSIALLLLIVVFGTAHRASAQTPDSGDGMNVAGLVIDYGEGRRSYAVIPFRESSVSGIELLRRSGLTLVSVPFGGLGEGVCSIGTTGCDVATCRRRLCQSADRESPFWQYLRQDDDGTWAPAALGATQAVVSDGDIDAWIWSGTPPTLPRTDIGSLREQLRVPPEWPSGGSDVPRAIVRTDAVAISAEEDATWRRRAPGLAVIAGVGCVGWLMVRRTRRSRPSVQ